MNLKQLSRNVIAHCLYYTGVLSLLGKKRFNDRALVLMYHRVVTEQEKSYCLSQDGIVVTKASFERQMRFLRDRFKVLSLNDFIDCIEGRKAFGYKSCLVTFDDGWRDNYQNAYPALKEIGIYAVIFLTTDFVGTSEHFWQERITELLCELHSTAKKDSNFMNSFLYKLPDREIDRIIKSKHGHLRGEISRYISVLKEMNKEEREEIIKCLSELTGRSESGDSKEEAFMSWDEIEVMAKNGITFGSHGKSHAILTRLDPWQIEKEVLESKAIIEEKLGMPVFSFSYPNGDCSEEVAEIVRNAVYRVAFTTGNGTHSVDEHPYKIKRVNIHEDMTANIPMFMARIVGLW